MGLAPPARHKGKRTLVGVGVAVVDWRRHYAIGDIHSAAGDMQHSRLHAARYARTHQYTIYYII